MIERVTGFTGTRHGMTAAQRLTIRSFLIVRQALGKNVAVHGDCVGADVEFNAILLELGGFEIRHRPGPAGHRMRANSPGATIVYPGKAFLARDDDLIADCARAKENGVLLATPHTYVEEFRGSGTWATIRRARKAHVRTIIVWPDGAAEEREHGRN